MSNEKYPFNEKAFIPCDHNCGECVAAYPVDCTEPEMQQEKLREAIEKAHTESLLSTYDVMSEEEAVNHVTLRAIKKSKIELEAAFSEVPEIKPEQGERLKQLKVVVCGAPHSGKSRLLLGLCENLPRDKRWLLRNCPDGEGTWTYKDETTTQFRRKGEFTPELVDWYVNSLNSPDLTAPIVLVDVGGRMSKENKEIMEQCDQAIILSNSLESILDWQKFCKDLNLPVMASVYSDYRGKEDVPNSHGLMSAHYLDRGVSSEELATRPTIQKLAEMIMGQVDLDDDVEKPKMTLEEIMQLPSEKIVELLLQGSDILQIGHLANILGKEKVKRTLRNGKEVEQIVWSGEDLLTISRLMHNHSAKLPEIVKIDGAAPSWLVAALTHECHPKLVQYNSPDGFVDIGCPRPAGEGSGIDFTTTTREDGWTIVDFALDPSQPLNPEKLADIMPPDLGMGAKVIISGRGPHWLTSSLAMAYHGRAKAVALFQPGVGSTVVWTHNAEIELGDTII